MVEENNNEQATIVTAEEEKISAPYYNAEEALLSMIIQDTDVAKFIAQTGLSDVHFQKQKNKILFPVIVRVWNTAGFCNFDLLSDRLEKEITSEGISKLEAIGGGDELMNIMNAIPTAVDLKVAQGYLDIIVEQYNLTRMKDLARWFGSLRRFNEDKIVDKISAMQQVLTNINSKHGLTRLDTLLLDATDRFKDRKANPDKYAGMKTGFLWLDTCKVIAKRRVCVIGAKTNIGKSIFAAQIIGELIKNGVRVLLFTPELDKEEYIDRLLCVMANVPLDTWKNASYLEEAEFDRITKVRNDLTNFAENLYIEDKGSQTCGFILNSVKKHMLNHPVDVVVIDYLQKMKYYGDNTKKEITDIMDKVCAFAKDEKLSFLVVSQLRRSKETEPQIYDLKESGDIENFADSVVLLHREGVIGQLGRTKGWYSVEKNRQGRTTTGAKVELKFNEDTLRFSEVFSDDKDGCGHSLATDDEQNLSYMSSGDKNGVQKG
jgi:replicative DNA helicase